MVTASAVRGAGLRLILHSKRAKGAAAEEGQERQHGEPDRTGDPPQGRPRLEAEHDAVEGEETGGTDQRHRREVP